MYFLARGCVTPGSVHTRALHSFIREEEERKRLTHSSSLPPSGARCDWSMQMEMMKVMMRNYMMLLFYLFN